jgi:hypothetical protein
MRPLVPAPRSRPELAITPSHVLARDYPETLGIFRRFGVDLPRRGGDPVMDAVDGDAGELLDTLAEAVAWRQRDGSG